MIHAQIRTYIYLTHRYIVKFLLVTVLAFLAGMVIGLQHTYAETSTNLYVPGAGNVGIAGTTGWGSTWAQGSSTSSVTLSYLGAHVRFWHSPPGYTPSIQDEHYRDWNNSSGGVTDAIYSSGWGDKATTNSGFYQSGGANYYTSYPHNLASCYTHWSTGNPC